jgi:serine/threonine protein kinase
LYISIFLEFPIFKFLTSFLIPDHFVAKISDFGLSTRLYHKAEVEMKPGKLPVCWMAPEVLKRGSTSTLSDVWSFGVLLWEIFELAMKRPYGVRGICDSLVFGEIFFTQHYR